MVVLGYFKVVVLWFGGGFIPVLFRVFFLQIWFIDSLVSKVGWVFFFLSLW